MVLDANGHATLTAEEFDELLGRGERARDLLTGAVALLREHGIATTAAGPTRDGTQRRRCHRVGVRGRAGARIEMRRLRTQAAKQAHEALAK